jgi:hypothetical protein
MRAVETGVPLQPPPDGVAFETWELAAVGPTWLPGPGEDALSPVDGVLEVHSDALVFRASEAVVARTGEPLVAVIPASEMRAIGPLSPGDPGAGRWMPKWQRRLRSPGFVVATDAGAWVFDGPHGPKRAQALSDRFGVA